MHNYDFKTLNDKEFEVLARDLLSKHFDIEFSSFKSGKDKGVDLRYTTEKNNNEIIVQVKHYANSSFSQLKFQLKKELEKVKELNPKRYIVVTSLELSAIEVDFIKNMFDPYIISSTDIFFNQTINKLLSDNSDIERNHYKLWFSSMNIISSILNKGIILKNSFFEDQIKSKVSKYVITPNHQKAISILKKQKILIITGDPGVGKSTLAEMVIYEFMKDGFEHLIIDDLISEANGLISFDKNKKQIIYFDDFLGANVYDILNSRNKESTLLNFIKLIKASENKFLVLTSRTTILNHATSQYEKFSYSNFHKEFKFQIYLDRYSDYEKACILYNHIYFSDIPDDFKKVFFIEKNYRKIINHKNYNPRLIDFFTSKTHLYELEKSSYFDFIIKNLENPNKIWEYSFEKQLNDYDRFLIFTLFSLKGEVSCSILEKCFNARLKNEILSYGLKMNVKAFNNSIKNLQDSYLNISRSNKDVLVSFMNPSISDFIISYLNSSFIELKRILEGVIYIEQILNVFEPKLSSFIYGGPYKKSVHSFNENSSECYDIVISSLTSLSLLNHSKDFNLEFLKVLFMIFNIHNIKNLEIVFEIVKKIDFNLVSEYKVNDYVFVLGLLSDKDGFDINILLNVNSFFTELFRFSEDFPTLDSVHELFILNNLSYEDFLSCNKRNEVVKDSVANVVKYWVMVDVEDDSLDYEYSVETDNSDWWWSLADDIVNIVSEKFDSVFNNVEHIYPSLLVEDLGIDYIGLQSDIEGSYYDSKMDDGSSYYDYHGVWSENTDQIDNLFDDFLS